MCAVEYVLFNECLLGSIYCVLISNRHSRNDVYSQSL